MVTTFSYRPIFHWLSSTLIFAFLMVGCAGFPPSPKLSPSLLEKQTRISGSGVPRSTVEILVNGKPVTQGSVDRDENFTLDVPSLAIGQVVTATQSVGGWTSTPSLPVTVQKATLAQVDIKPAQSITIEQGHTQRFSVSGVFSNGMRADPLAGVAWSNKNPKVASVDSTGAVTGIKAGTTSIWASQEDVQSSQTIVTVKPPSPNVMGTLVAGETKVEGQAEPFASIQVLINGIPHGTTVQADEQGRWQTGGLSTLDENDQVSSTQILNNIQSDLSSAVKVLPDSPPVLEPVGDQSVELGDTLSLTLTVTDPDSDKLTFEMIQAPRLVNSTLDSESGLFTFTPTSDQVGVMTVTFSVSDGNSTHKETITIDVTLPKNLVVLVDNQDGTVGRINVINAGGAQALDQSSQAVGLGSATTAPSQPFVLKKDQIQGVFKGALEAKPEDPLKFILYFEADSTELTPDSARQLPEIISTIANRSVPDIGVIGHTDRTSSEEYNHQVSMDRANAVRDMIVAIGIAPEVIEVTGHGENNPVVPTADEVNEPLNRRVEIIVR